MKPYSKFMLSAALGITFSTQAFAQWPNDKTIEVVVGFAAGGGTDVMARKVFKVVEKKLGGKANFIIVNKPGASGDIANSYVAKANPDGYTIGIINVPSYLYVPMSRKANYSPDDFKLVARIMDDPTVMVVKSDSKLTNLPEIVNQLRANPKSISFGMNGEGTNGHLALLRLQEVTKVDYNIIPYRGTAQQKTDILGGSLNVALISAGEVPELHNGKEAGMKVISQLSSARSTVLAQAPTAKEALNQDVIMTSERGVAVPKGVPATIVSKLEAVINETLKDPEYLATAAGDEPFLSFLTGDKWQAALNENAKTLKALIDKLPKQ